MSDLLNYSISYNKNPKLFHNYSDIPLISPINNGSTQKITLPSLTSLTDHLNLEFRVKTKDLPLTETNLNYYNINQAITPPSSENGSSYDSKASSPMVASETSAATTASANEKKRRQRSGPSCDSCRSRKVKCDADIIILSTMESTTVEILSGLGYDAAEIAKINSGDSLFYKKNMDFRLLKSKNKLIKFKSCTACFNKDKRCCFDKGFTKDDIIIFNRSEKSDTVPNVKRSMDETVASPQKKAKLEATEKKKSCLNCRKRKVKCIIDSVNEVCENCIKKSDSCVFENKKDKKE